MRQLGGGFVFGLIAIGILGGGCTSKKTEVSPNTLHLMSQEKIKGLDPAYADDQYVSPEVGKAYEGLLQYHYLKRPYVLIPNLAESMPQISQDGKTLTFRIKKGVVFHDDPCFKETGGKGRELTAEDFIYSLKRIADPKTVSTGWWVFDGKIQGLNEWQAEATQSGKADYSRPVEGLKALDRYTLQIKLVQRSAQFLYALAMPFSFVVPKEAIDHYGNEFLNHAVGTGPFRLEEFNGSTKVVWKRNPTYRKELYPSEGDKTDKAEGRLADAGKPLPLADGVVVHVFEQSQPGWLSFLSGKLDVAPIPKEGYAQAITPSKELSPELKEKGITLHKDPGMDVTHQAFNMADPLLGKNKYLRQAISLAIDQEAWNDLFYNGRAIAAQGPIPPEVEGYDPDFKNPYRQFNLKKAKELLAKAGFPEGKGLPPIEYMTTADTTGRQAGEFLVKSLAAIGVQLKLVSYSWPEFSAAIKNKKGQMWGTGWGADYPDAENFLQLFYSKNVSPGPNDANYSNPEFDRLYEKALAMNDTPARTALYRQMVKMVVEDCPWVFGAHRISYSPVQRWLKNYKIHEFDVAKSKYYRVDPALKK